MKTKTNTSFILTSFDEYRARLRNSYVGILVIFLIDILFYLLKLYELSRAKNWFFLIATVLVFLYFIVSTVLYHKKKHESRKTILLVDADGIFLSSFGQILWKQIKKIYLSGPKEFENSSGLYLYIERKNGLLCGLCLNQYLGSFNVFRLKSCLVSFAAGKVEINVKVPLWFYNF